MSNINSNLNNLFGNFQNSRNYLKKMPDINKSKTVNDENNLLSTDKKDSVANKSLFYLDCDDRMSYNDLLNISDDDIVIEEQGSLFDSFSNKVVSFVQDKIKGDKSLQKDIDDFHAAWTRLAGSG